MKALLFLARRHLLHHRVRSLVLVAVLTIILSIPILANLVVGQAERSLIARAETTPLVYGAQGSQIELVLASAYFNGATAGEIPMSDYTGMIDLAQFDLVPLRLGVTARGFPLVGVDHEYFRVRGLAVQAGFLPLKIGEVVLGADVARHLSLSVGDTIRTDATQTFDLAGAYPVVLTVSGVLPPTQTADDQAVFADLQTAWIAEGISHGHQALDPIRDWKYLLEAEDDQVIANAGLPTLTRITEENRDQFHHHGDEGDLPLSAILVFPRNAKAAALLKGRVADREETRQIVDVKTEIDGLLTRVFEVKAVLQNVVAAMAVATLAALALVVVLSVRMRRREFEIANQIGAARRHAVWLVLVELALVALVALVLSGLIALAVEVTAPQALQGWLTGG